MKYRNALTRNKMKAQRGIAAVWMAFTLVPVLGVTFWAVEGTRYIQETNRLRDAAKAASIAETIEDKRDTYAADEQRISGAYIHDYVRNIQVSNVAVEWVHQPQTDTQDEYIQYSVNATTTHNSWFSSDLIPSFDTTEDLNGIGVAKKYPIILGDKNIDIVFVSDFSGSMGWQWGSSSSCTSSNCKITDLKVAVKAIADKLLCSDITSDPVTGEDACSDDDQSGLSSKLDNRIAVVPFNIRTRETNDSGTEFAVSQLRYRDDVDTSDSERSYEQVNWNKWRKYSSEEVYDCSEDQSECPNQKSGERKQAQRLVSIFDIDEDDDNRSYHADVYDYVNFSLTVSEMFESTFPDLKTKYRVTDNELYRGYGSSSVGQFFSIALTSDRDNIDQIDDMFASGSTAAFQGMLRGFQHLAAGKPDTTDEDELATYDEKIKMVIVLSDGVESPNNGILSALVTEGMCDKAREEIPGLYIAVIGIDFQASEQSGFQDCVIDVDEDIIDVTDTDDFIEVLEELIKKGSRGTGVTRLYG
ncbi:pilus assembly protein TadG [Vibrio cionasavignyae]|uniref:TadE/TadG family type IV pilus assembly protein n=1 Tax=Vibrio cionasavignyae TaxID=2910252 RepID=UPI003D0A98F3